ncbi:hypothetical protein, partial [Cronobacter malonaticus]|uniref:hypothetical protein n=1 Tax=Cronobacter malonaticus TaxID=413503 RepID=UPI00131A33CC
VGGAFAGGLHYTFWAVNGGIPSGFLGALILGAPDRPGLVPGFVGGAFAGGLHYTFWAVNGGIPSGFLGALILGA